MSSDEASFGVTNTSISSDYEEPSDVGARAAPLSQVYVPGPEYPEYLALSNEEVPVGDQPYVATDSPIAQYSGYIIVSDLEDESDDGPTDYPADEGDDNDSSGDDANDEDEEEASEEDKDDEEEEEDEHLAPADSTATASPVVDLVSSAKETEPFETDESTSDHTPPPAYCTTTRMSIIAQTPIPFLSEAEVDRLLAIPTPPLSPLTLLSSPFPQIPSPPFLEAGIRLRTASPPPLPLSPSLPLPPPIILLRTRASLVLMRVTAPSTYILAPRSRTPPSGTPPILPIPLPTSSLPLPLTFTDHRADVPKAVLPPRKRLCIYPNPRFEVGESSSAATARSTRGFRADYGFVGTLDAEIRRDIDREVGYRITNIWVDPAVAAEEIPPTTLAELSQRVTDFVTTIRKDTNEIYVMLDYA
ncbi:hypothetical protein Tco_0972451 [Tanacetum coccineum]